jgi:uncharacterized protein (DUF362 family)
LEDEVSLAESVKTNMSASRVSSFRCKDYDPDKVLQAVTKAVDELGGIDRFIKKGDRVLLKANLLIARTPDKLVTTDPEIVRAVAHLVKKAGGKPYIGDSPAMGSAEKVAAKSGISDVARSEGIEVINFHQPVEVDNPSASRTSLVLSPVREKPSGTWRPALISCISPACWSTSTAKSRRN